MERNRLQLMYAAYNGRDLDGLLAMVTDDVDWPDWPRPGRIHGKAAVSSYWTQQWSRTRTHDDPTDYTRNPNGRISVRGNQVIRSTDGRLVATGSFHHVFDVDGLLISRMDLVAGAAPSPAPG